MGRQAYLNRLALGRSPYEAPERSGSSSANAGVSTQQRIPGLHADGYAQNYDDRGHPVNIESRSSGRELRRAKNDILSTMGIVVSEESNAAGSSEQKRADMIAAENDYGLVLATLDQISVFLSSWWTSSLTGRVQTFKRYTHTPLLAMISRERFSLGTVGFYFAGIPTWTVSTCLMICRHQPLERVISSLQNLCPNDDLFSKIIRSSLTMLHSAARGSLLVLGIQTYMYSLLQSLHLVNPQSFPGVQFLIPFGDYSRLLSPQLPTDLTLQSLSGFAFDFLKTPAVLLHLYLYLRPVLEIRLYRFIRRRLPKPSLADELSIKIAMENDLIDWMVPTLGRRSEEENSRSNMSFVEDLLYELDFLRWWVLKRLRINSSRARPPSSSSADVRPPQDGQGSLPVSMDRLQTERLSRTRRLQRQSAVPPAPEEVMRGEIPRAISPSLPVTGQAPEQAVSFGENRVLPSEENRISQSPAEMSNGGDLSELAPLRPPSAMSPPTNSSSNAENIDPSLADLPVESRLNSRSNTLFSRPSSPDTSSPASPRVRASLIHQNSDVITMQLELLGNRQARDHGQATPPIVDETEQADINGELDRRRSISEFLDNLLSNQGQNLSTIVNTDAIDSDGLSNMTMAPTSATGNSSQAAISSEIGTTQIGTRPAAEEPVTSLGNILPDSVEEPNQENIPHQTFEGEATNDFNSGIYPRITDSNIPADASTNNPLTPHRVTILSSHPVDSLASHIAAMVTVVLFLPLESLYLRSLASTYLSCVQAPAALRSDIRPIGAWGGGGSRADILAYVGKLILMMGMQAAVNTSVWGIISGAAIRIGKRFCGWGTL